MTDRHTHNHHANGIFGIEDTEAEDIGQAEGNGYHHKAAGRDRVGKVPKKPFPPDAFEPVDPFANPYKSVFTNNLRKIEPEPEGLLACLKHVNCSYLSSDKPPNLLQLKQHAQSLTVLIREMTVSTKAGIIDNENANLPYARPFEDSQSFDWLNNLEEMYDIEDEHHNQPLTSILNMLERSPVTAENRNKCPLHELVDADALVQPYPLATHTRLIQHANELLERLDHEYSAQGGLLAIYPTNQKKEYREKAEKTVLGQMIFWVQNLVQRIHHLERLYANALDLLAKEAVVPTETLSSLGTRGRKGREVVYPQDKFVLVNVGDDLWDFLNAEFERKEVIDTQVDKNYRDLGTTGEKIWAQRGGREFAQGITYIDVYTRYYRLRDNPLKTIFIIPAYEIHPGTLVTREIEQQPTVVSVVKPVWPERMSVLEQRHKDDMAELKLKRHELPAEQRKVADRENDIALLKQDRVTLKAEMQTVKAERDQCFSALKEPGNMSKMQILDSIANAQKARIEASELRAKYEAQIEATKKAMEEAKARAEDMRKARQETDEKLKASRAENDKLIEQRQKAADDRDADIARSAQETHRLLKEVWLKQVTESEILIQFLASKDMQTALAGVTIPDNIKKLAEASAKRKFDPVAGAIPDGIGKLKRPSSSSSSEGDTGGPGGGGGGAGATGEISKAPKTARWRKGTQRHFDSFSSGHSPVTATLDSSKNHTFEALGRSTAFEDLTTTGGAPKTPDSAGSTQTHVSGNLKKVQFSSTNLGSMGTGEPPSKKAKTSGETPT